MDRIVIISVKFLSDGQKERLKKAIRKRGFEAVFCDTETEALSMAGIAEIIFSSYSSLAKAAPNLKWFCTPYAGVEEYTKPGAFLSPAAVLTNSSGAYGVTISEHIIMVILELLRRRREYTAHLANREWVRQLPVRSIHGSRILMLGTGNIGQETAKRLKSFDPLRVTGLNRSGRQPGNMFDEVQKIERLKEFLPDTDILIMALPGTSETCRIMDREALSLLPDGALLINVGRGQSVDEPALLQELQAERLYASLDVFETEPLPADHPFWECENLLITPHVAGDLTLPYTRDKAIEMFLRDLKRYCKGKPLKKQVDLDAGY